MKGKNEKQSDAGIVNRVFGTYKVPLQDIYIGAPRYNLINEGFPIFPYNKH